MKRLLFLIISMVLTYSVNAAHIHDLQLNARSIGSGNSDLCSAAPAINPAGIAPVSKAYLEISQARFGYDEYGYQIISAIPLSFGVLGIGFDQIIIQNEPYERLIFDGRGIPVIDPATNKQAVVIDYDPAIDSQWSLSYGINLSDVVKAGFTANLFHLKIGENYAWGVDGDLGLIVNFLYDLKAGLVVRHINREQIIWHKPYRERTGERQIRAGLTYNWLLIKCRLSANYHQKIEKADTGKGNIGIAYYGLEPVEIRAGWEADHLNLGVGISWEQVVLDYAVITNADIDAANRVSVKIIF